MGGGGDGDDARARARDCQANKWREPGSEKVISAHWFSIQQRGNSKNIAMSIGY